MPELPEVEVTRLSFADNIAGARISSVFLGKSLRWPLGLDPDELVGRQVLAVRRRGKYLLLDLNQGLLLMHLGMSGSLRFAKKLPELEKHDHFELQTTRGALRLNDPRRFGAVVYAQSQEAPEAQKLLGGLGVEPLEEGFTPEHLYAGLHKRKVAVKQALLAGDIVVGVGNIYASEALFRAGIRPTKAANLISKVAAEKLHRAIIEVLSIALQHGGSTLRNFSSAAGKTGYFQLKVMVYGRDGEPCHVCKTPIKKITQGQRSTFYCPTCQK